MREKSLSKTLSPIKDRIFGSKTNKKGSAATKYSAKEIQFSSSVITTLENKKDEYNKKHPNKKVTLATLKAVFRRGSGAYSNSHRPNITRSGWAFARVNKFLLKKGGTKVKAAYIQDDDLMQKGAILNSSCKTYISQNKSVIKTGYYLNLSEFSSMIDPYGQIPLNLTYTLVTYNSGNQDGLSLINTINPINLQNELADILNIPINKAQVVVGLYIEMGKKLKSISQIEGNNIIIIDRDMLVCKSEKNDALMEQGGLIEDKNGFLKYTIDKENNEIIIDNIKVYVQKIGTGKKLINEIKKMSKQLDIPITLYAEPQDESINDDELREFYLSQGFDYHPDDVDYKYFVWGNIKYNKGGNIGEIKSATTFDVNNLNIRYEEGVETKKETSLSVKSLWEKSKKYFIDKGFKVINGSISKTDYGTSCYYYINYEQKSSENYGIGWKIRVSDHSATNLSRLQSEHFIFNEIDIDKVMNEAELFFKPELFKKNEVSKEIIEEKIVIVPKDSNVKVVAENVYNPLIDNIINDLGISLKGNQTYLVKRVKTIKGIVNERIDKYDDGVYIGQEITCVNCGWHWNTNQSDEYDKYVCHKCGFDNRTFYDSEPIGFENGGIFDVTYNKILEGSINSDDGAIYLDENGIDVTEEIYDKLRNAEELFRKKGRGLQVDDIITVKGKNGINDFKGNFRGYTNEGKLVVVYDGGKQMTINKDEYYADGGKLKTPHTIYEIAKKHNVSLQNISNALYNGIETEKEHTKDESVAKVIALHHLWESPIYYDKLKEMEKSMHIDEHYEDIRKIYAIGGIVDPIMSFRTPSGEPTKLTYLQQVLVRTAAFKNWFGDWETAANQFMLNGRQDYVKVFENVSKVVDKITFEPKVVYHGTRTDAEFFIFDVSKKDGVGRPYGYFAHNEEYSQNFTTSSQRSVPNSQPFMYKCFASVKNPFYAIGHEYYNIQQDAEYWLNEISISIARDKYGTNADENKINGIKKVVQSQISGYVKQTFSVRNMSFWLLIARDVNKNFKFFLNNYDYDGVFYAEEFGMPYNVDNPAEFTEAVTVFEPKQVKLADGRNINFDPMNEDIRFKDGGKVPNTDEIIINNDYFMNKRQNLRNLLTNNKYAEGGEVVANKLSNGNDGKKGGYFEGRSHADGGIKAYNKDTGQMIEVEGQEVIITKGAVNDTLKREFEGEMLTNREILSRINQSGGGVSFAKGGQMAGDSCGCSGKKYKYGGEMVDDYSIVKMMNEPFKIINDNFAYARAFADMLVQKLK